MTRCLQMFRWLDVVVVGKQTELERERETYRESGRQRDRETERKRQNDTWKHTEIERDREKKTE